MASTAVAVRFRQPQALRSRSIVVNSISRWLPPLAWHLGALGAAIGTVLPWAHIGGRSRSGFDTAEIMLTLGVDGLPSGLAWAARLWYLGTLAGLAAWAIGTLVRTHWIRAAAGPLCWAALGMVGVTWLAADRAEVVAGRTIGPAVAVTGLAVMGLAERRMRTNETRTPR